MDYWLANVNVIATERCADIRREIATYHLSHSALSNTRWFEQRMLSLGLWLVAVGERLRQRYEISETKTSFTGI